MPIPRTELTRQAEDTARRVLEEWLLPAAGDGTAGAVAPAPPKPDQRPGRPRRPGTAAGGDGTQGQGRWAVGVAGSGVSHYRDASSRLDLLVVGPADAVVRFRSARPARRDGRGPGSCHDLPAWAGGGKLILLSWDELDHATHAAEEGAVILLTGAQPLLDESGRLERAVTHVNQLPAQWYQGRVAHHYRALRRRTASMAWNLRRGQGLAFLANFVQWLEHLLLLCLYADGQPPVENKWLLQAAMRTSLGRLLRGGLYDLLSRLGDVATLGGSYDPRKNRLFGLITDLHHQLVSGLRQRGLLDEREGTKEDRP